MMDWSAFDVWMCALFVVGPIWEFAAPHVRKAGGRCSIASFLSQQGGALNYPQYLNFTTPSKLSSANRTAQTLIIMQPSQNVSSSQ
jgi:hypothetical protein